MHLDKNKNVLVTHEPSLDDEHLQLLKEKITQNNTLKTIKDNLQSTKRNILKHLHDDIIDQTGSESI